MTKTSIVVGDICRWSPDKVYRYELWRSWRDMYAGQGYVAFIGLNPSTADETENDPTVRRCMNFTRRWGYSQMVMLNLFAFRATDPADMKKASDPVGPENDSVLLERSRGAEVVVACWGTHGVHMGRGEAVRQMIPGLQKLRLTKDGHPQHPLYLPASLCPVNWKG